MATTGTVSTLTEDLIAVITKTNKDTQHFRALKNRVDDHLKSSQYGRTDQFAVAKQLEGLQEKFQVLCKDDLADALRLRLNELDEHRGSWFPEILSLFLQLANRPAQLSSVDRIQKAELEKTEKPLTWTELDASGSAFCDEDIWEYVDFGAGSSDDDISSVSSDSQPPRVPPQHSIALEEDYVIPDEIFSSGENEKLITSIKEVQFWRDENIVDPTKGEKPASRVISELQIARETIFMLQGLPTSLFWRLDGNVEVDRRYALSHLSYAALSSLLRTLSTCGTKIDILRQFVQTPQSVSYLQTFHRCIEGCLSKFDIFLSETQSQYLSPTFPISASILQLSEAVSCESKLLLLLADLVASLKQTESESTTRCLDLLYDLVCMTQATGDENQQVAIAKIFFSCFETYFRPVRLWMETGQLEVSMVPFFISEVPGNNDLRTLWHDWYALDKSNRLQDAPKFIQPFADKVFIAGKSMVFLQHLNVPEGLESSRKSSLKFEDVFPPNSSPSFCLPFYALLEAAFGRMVNENHAFTSSRLRTELDEQCGLWMSLQALEYIYLCKDMSLCGPIDTKIFDLIDRRGAWSDRFLLTDLAQSAFGTMPFIDPSRLIVRSSPDAHPNPHGHSRSVQILNTLSFDYILPWPVANIITKNGILSYQRISTFLMQIRRAKYIIVKQRLQYAHESDKLSGNKGNTQSYALRHHMLWFLNVLYSHLTDFVISTATESLRKALSSSNDVDAMIVAHRTYMSSLEEQLFLSENLHPLHKATITLLDLCVSFADLQAARYKDHQFDSTKTPRKSTKPFSSGMTPKKTRYEYSYGDEDPTDDEESDDSDDDGHHSRARTLPFHNSQYVQRLKDIKDQFNRLVTFLAAGLKGVGRVDGHVSWEMLAEKLEWRKEGQIILS